MVCVALYWFGSRTQEEQMDSNDMRYFDPLLSSMGHHRNDDSCSEDDETGFQTAHQEFEQKIREVGFFLRFST